MKNNFYKTLRNSGLILLVALTFACRKDRVNPEDSTNGPAQPSPVVQGLYVLNQANWGSNKSSIDYYNYETGKYTRDIYGAANPEITLGLGDVGNDIKIYGSKMYVVVNGSDKVEVLDAKTAKRVAKIDIPNCRYVTFNKNFAYVTSYEGYVAVIDTTALSTIKAKITVGNQPEEMAVVGNKLYVANSGGYNYPNYDRTVSVVDLTTNKEIKKIDVAINLEHMQADTYGDIYVTSRGNYEDIPSKLVVIDSKTDAIKKTFDIPVTNLWINGDEAYLYSYNFNTKASTYVKINVKNETVVSDKFITDGTDTKIVKPFGIAVDPVTGFVYVTDAKNYTTPGTLYCFDKTGKQVTSFVTGDIPAYLAFKMK